MRYLGTPEAVREMVSWLGRDDKHSFDFMLGLVGSPVPDVALSELWRGIADPDCAVSSNFLHAMMVLMRSPQSSFELGLKADDKNWEAARQELLRAISGKRGVALAISLATMLETHQEGKIHPIDKSMAEQVAASFDLFPVKKQHEILESHWDLIRSPLFLPILRKYAQQYDHPALSELALRRWYELAPDEARAAILVEIARPEPRFSARLLGMLPDKTLPALEQSLAEHLAADPDGSAVDNVASLLQRYATDAVLPQVLPVVDKYVGKWACAVQSPLLAYLLRASPPVARPRIEAAMAARGEGYSSCNHILLTDLGALQNDPLLEEVALRALEDDDPQVAQNAASFLSKYGSADVEHTLWEHLIQWHEKWRGHEAELGKDSDESNSNFGQNALGSTLITAVAEGQAWLSGEAKLQRLKQLAIDKQMQQQLDDMIADWKQPPSTISYSRTNDEDYFHVLQYGTESLTRLKEKLAQFPAGTIFGWTDAEGDAHSEKILRELREFLSSHQMSLKSTTNN